MASELDSQDFDNPNESSSEPLIDAPAVKVDTGQAELPQSITVRRKRRRRNFAPSSTEYSRTHAEPVYVAPTPEVVSGTHRRRSRRRSNRQNYRKIWRIVMFVAIHVVFITFLVFLWMKITAKVAE
jgi:hypothetical protein